MLAWWWIERVLVLWWWVWYPAGPDKVRTLVLLDLYLYRVWPACSLSALLCKSVSSAVISTKDDCSDDVRAESKQLLGNLEERWSRCGESNDLLTASKAPLTALASFVCGNDNPRVHTRYHLQFCIHQPSIQSRPWYCIGKMCVHQHMLKSHDICNAFGIWHASQLAFSQHHLHKTWVHDTQCKISHLHSMCTMHM